MEVSYMKKIKQMASYRVKFDRHFVYTEGRGLGMGNN